MTGFCQDRDLLSVEPIIFLVSGFPSQELAAGSDGVLSGTTFTSASCDFEAAGTQPGMVLCTYTTCPSEGRALEILAVQSATTLTVSVLRGDDEATSVPPPSGQNLSFYIRTYNSQVRTTSSMLSEKLRQLAEVAGIDTADYADSAQLRITAVYAALGDIFVARAENAAAYDANWIKARHYCNESRRLQLQLRLVVDADGDGLAEQTRTLGNMTLRRA